jgi:hypothetical protein
MCCEGEISVCLGCPTNEEITSCGGLSSGEGEQHQCLPSSCLLSLLLNSTAMVENIVRWPMSVDSGSLESFFIDLKPTGEQGFCQERCQR